ncbi:MAG: TetR/AcrR family transcriptional regulator [Alphaproteobacteria bacterium]|jgi:AcrR family transcriptional regulator|nr:TetR/AcrR family transcriptional regulator [Alphaproteobacteria bacterium]
MLQRPDKNNDGRRVRGADNKRKIVGALLNLIEAGNARPSAEDVASEAGVGLRTVFRHFADMDSLHSAVSERMTAEIKPIIDRPFAATDWRAKLDELVDRRVEMFERLLPFKIAGDVHRYGSVFLTAEHKELVRVQAEALKRVLPAKLAGDKARFAVLDLALSFDAWKRLRQDQGLAVRDARAALRFAASALTSSEPGR